MIRQWLSRVTLPEQRQSFVVSMSVFFATLLLLSLAGILLLILARGSAYFWPAAIYQVSFTHPSSKEPLQVFAKLTEGSGDAHDRVWWLNYTNAEAPFGTQVVINESELRTRTLATQSAEIALFDGRSMMAEPLYLQDRLGSRHVLADYDRLQQEVVELANQIETIRTRRLADIHTNLAELDLRNVAQDAPARVRLNVAFAKWQRQIVQLEAQLEQYRLYVAFADGKEYSLPLNQIRELVYVGQLSTWQKWAVTVNQIGVFLTESPKQANTAGGVFPALFGTVLMVFLMTIIVTPFGVLAAIYLAEYAPDNLVTAAIRISVSNMAGVPSIVYGVFGLGFFVYGLGGNIDSLFFADKLPAPTMGSPGVLWASLTMAILTLPVVIVATEEGLRRVPEGLKAGSYALGATKAETIINTVLPMASPGIMTGLILAIARAAGEVAPLMLIGAVKFAPNLPIDSDFPYLHLDRQFMHLGVLIYDGAFHSQTDAKGTSMMFASCLLLLVVVFVLNIAAVFMRTRLRKRYSRG